MTDAPTVRGAPVERPYGPAVTAVVVTRGPSEYLEQTLAALAGQDRAPQQVVLVDADPHGPDPGLGSLVAGHWSAGPTDPSRVTVHAAPHASTFGEAVRQGLAAADLAGGREGWLWLLHDDSAPEPGALAALLRAVELAPSVAVAGCKQRTWSLPGETPRVVEVGIATSRFGRRMTGIDEPEVDQGQHDGREDVLGVGIAGALVRRDVWTDLGGTDPALGPYGDGLDLSRRARLAGHRVVVVPRAVVHHAQATLARPLGGAVLHRPGWDARRSAQARRQAYLHSQLVGVPLPLVPVVAVLAVVSGLVRALGRLVTKEPHLVLAELVAPAAVLLRPVRVVRARRRAASTARVRRRALRPLQVTWRDVWRQSQDRRLAAAELRRTRQAPSELELAELAALRGRRRRALAGVLLLAVGLTAVTLGPVITRVLGGARLLGGTLELGDAGPGGVWAAALSGWVAVGLGEPGPADPLLLALTPLTALLGTVGRAAALTLLGALLLSALGAWFAAGAATRSTALRAWAALVWTGAPALLLALDDLRLGAVLAHVALPWVALGVARGLGVARVDVVESGLVGAQREPGGTSAVADPGPPLARPTTTEASLAATAGAGLALAVVTAGAPVLLPACLLALAAIALVVRRRRRLLWVALPSLALQGPTIAAAVQRGDAWRLPLTDPGLPVASVPAPAWQQLLGWPVVPPSWAELASQVTALAATGLVVLLAAVALTRAGGRGRAVRVAWAVAAAGLLAAGGAGRVETGLAAGEGLGTVLATAWPGSGLSLALLGLLTAAVLGADGLRQAMARHSFGWRQVTAGLVTLAAVAGPALVLGSWTWATRDAGSHRAAEEPLALELLDGPVVPAVGREAQSAELSARVLSLRTDPDGQVEATLLRQDGRQLTEVARSVVAREVGGAPGQGRPVEPDAADLVLADAAARLATGTAEEVAAELAGLGVASVLVPPPGEDGSTQARAALIGRIDSTPALERMTETGAGIIWRVATGELGTTSAWARLVDADGGPAGTLVEPVPANGTDVSTRVPAGEPRLLVLAERADPGWYATLDGVPLRAVETPWQQAFELGEEGGLLVVGHAPASRTPWLVLQGTVLLATVLLALPVRRRRGGARW
ncbi:glycosyltransferase family 2 protein [Actinotalea sp. BY-33]|uniref:Glycosyltransferase family 2 protein n=1 Tax=Actinotalea soli TaxID=2819234 RepID=A0A939LNR0_9CELL|nr:glycosyltransferase [Actinotalea soli]MBO1750929.1 glycosyltransferase family 2 protein [Actinotalea soli]